MEETQAAAETAQVIQNWALAPQTQWTVIIGIGIYLLIMIYIGFWSSRKIKGMSDFLVAGRRLPLWMASATLLATWFGAGSSMGVAATVYSDGISGVLADPFAASISLLIAGVFFVGILRRLKCLTVTDIIERRYGKWAGIYTSAWMIPVYVGWLGAQLLGMGVILNVLTGMNTMVGTVIGAAVVLIYTYAGGMWAVTLTDIVQVSLIILGLFLIVPGAIHEAGGLEAVMGSLQPGDLSLGIQSFSGSATPSFDDWTYYIGSWIVMGLGCAVGQDLIQRSLSSRNERIAVSSSIISGFLYMMIGLVPITIGFVARIVLAKHGITAENIGEDIDNKVLPQMAIIILGNLHPIILTVFLAALVSAIMSSADSSLLAGCSLFCNNVVKPLFPRFNDRKLLMLTRVSTIVMLLISLVMAINVKSIYSLMINSWSSQLVIVFIPVVTALYVKRASKHAAWATMITSTAVWFAYTFIHVVGTDMSFGELVNSDLFEHALTNGAVYGFAAGLIAFVCCYFGERIPHWLLDSEPDEEED